MTRRYSPGSAMARSKVSSDASACGHRTSRGRVRSKATSAAVEVNLTVLDADSHDGVVRARDRGDDEKDEEEEDEGEPERAEATHARTSACGIMKLCTAAAANGGG